jgi:hypothetical protein
LGAIIAVAFILKKRMRRLFTWSNERAHPTLEKIDRVFFTNEWEAIHPHHYLHSMTMLCSDHAPLVLKAGDSYAGKKKISLQVVLGSCSRVQGSGCLCMEMPFA